MKKNTTRVILALLLVVAMMFTMTACQKPVEPVDPVVPEVVVTIALDKTAIDNFTVGETKNITATVTPADAKITWSSSNPSVATVDQTGKVEAKAPGTTLITAKSEDGKTEKSCAVTVVAGKVDVTGVKLDSEAASVGIGAVVTLKATVAPANADNKDVTWKSDNEKVATVKDGVVTALSEGTATITVTTVDGAKTATFKITVVYATGDYKDVAALIEALKVTPANAKAKEADIVAARKAFNALSVNDQYLLETESTYATLLNAEKTLNQAYAQVAIDAINAIPAQINILTQGAVTESGMYDAKVAIEAARAAYNGLIDVQKALITNTQVKTLTDAEATLANIAAAYPVAQKIAALPYAEITLDNAAEVTALAAQYKALTAAQKAYVYNAVRLTEAQAVVLQLQHEVEAKKVFAAIDAIGFITTYDAAKPAVEAAVKAYDAYKAWYKTNYNATLADNADANMVYSTKKNDLASLKNNWHYISILKDARIQLANARINNLTSIQPTTTVVGGVAVSTISSEHYAEIIACAKLAKECADYPFHADETASITAVNTTALDGASIGKIQFMINGYRELLLSQLADKVNKLTVADYTDLNWLTLEGIVYIEGRNNIATFDTTNTTYTNLLALIAAYDAEVANIDAVKTIAKTLADAKTAAQNQIKAVETAFTADVKKTYSAANVAVIEKLIQQAKVDVQACKTVAEIAPVLTAFEKSVEDVLTLVEDAAAQLAAYKKAQVEALTAHRKTKVDAEYATPADLDAAVTAGAAAINAVSKTWTANNEAKVNAEIAEAKAAVDTAYRAAVVAVDAVKTKAQTLAAEKAAAVAAINAAVEALNEVKFTAENWTAINNTAKTAIDAINAMANNSKIAETQTKALADIAKVLNIQKTFEKAILDSAAALANLGYAFDYADAEYINVLATLDASITKITAAKPAVRAAEYTEENAALIVAYIKNGLLDLTVAQSKADAEALVKKVAGLVNAVAKKDVFSIALFSDATATTPVSTLNTTQYAYNANIDVTNRWVGITYKTANGAAEAAVTDIIPLTADLLSKTKADKTGIININYRNAATPIVVSITVKNIITLGAATGSDAPVANFTLGAKMTANTLGKMTYTSTIDNGTEFIPLANVTAECFKLNEAGTELEVIKAGKFTATVVYGDKSFTYEVNVAYDKVTAENSPVSKVSGNTAQVMGKLAAVNAKVTLDKDVDPATVVTWYVNNVSTGVTGLTYAFTPTEIGTYTITAKVGATILNGNVVVTVTADTVQKVEIAVTAGDAVQALDTARQDQVTFGATMNANTDPKNTYTWNVKFSATKVDLTNATAVADLKAAANVAGINTNVTNEFKFIPTEKLAGFYYVYATGTNIDDADNKVDSNIVVIEVQKGILDAATPVLDDNVLYVGQSVADGIVIKAGQTTMTFGAEVITGTWAFADDTAIFENKGTQNLAVKFTPADANFAVYTTNVSVDVFVPVQLIEMTASSDIIGISGIGGTTPTAVTLTTAVYPKNADEAVKFTVVPTVVGSFTDASVTAGLKAENLFVFDEASKTLTLNPIFTATDLTTITSASVTITYAVEDKTGYTGTDRTETVTITLK